MSFSSLRLLYECVDWWGVGGPSGGQHFWLMELPTCVSGHSKRAQTGGVWVLSLSRLLVGCLSWLGIQALPHCIRLHESEAENNPASVALATATAKCALYLLLLILCSSSFQLCTRSVKALLLWFANIILISLV